MPLHVMSTCAHHQEVKIALHSLWYHHTYRWPSHAQVERGLLSVEAWNKLIIKQKFCASGWLITEINILRCTVSKTSKKSPFLFYFQRSPPLARGLWWSSAVCWAKARCANSLGEKESFTVNYLHSSWRADASKFRCGWGFPRVFQYFRFGKIFSPFIFYYFQRHTIKTALGDRLLWCNDRLHATVDPFV